MIYSVCCSEFNAWNDFTRIKEMSIIWNLICQRILINKGKNRSAVSFLTPKSVLRREWNVFMYSFKFIYLRYAVFLDCTTFRLIPRHYSTIPLPIQISVFLKNSICLVNKILKTLVIKINVIIITQQSLYIILRYHFTVLKFTVFYILCGIICCLLYTSRCV